LGCDAPAGEDAEDKNSSSGESDRKVCACIGLFFLLTPQGCDTDSTSDGAIFEDAHCHDLTLPAGKYYLANAGFTLCDMLLVPY
jgi:hypothetical protein